MDESNSPKNNSPMNTDAIEKTSHIKLADMLKTECVTTPSTQKHVFKNET